MIFIPSNNVHVRRSENFTAVYCAVCLINHTYINCFPPSEYHTLSKCILLIVKKKISSEIRFYCSRAIHDLSYSALLVQQGLTNKAFFI